MLLSRKGGQGTLPNFIAYTDQLDRSVIRTNLDQCLYRDLEVVLQACPTSKTYFDEKGKVQPNSRSCFEQAVSNKQQVRTHGDARDMF